MNIESFLMLFSPVTSPTLICPCPYPHKSSSLRMLWDNQDSKPANSTLNPSPKEYFFLAEIIAIYNFQFHKGKVYILHTRFNFVTWAHVYRTFTRQSPETVQAVEHANTKMHFLTKWWPKALPLLDNSYRHMSTHT